ncbi:ribonuclease J [Hippea maritima]|uniref:Ribonuclease J n=1 Tax=Hippea maritima (strain ATCC 700847 / DSM 10411 / MH2) TaxID=760142 RepID=F2LWN9_HIPMA|nr:ribonuclease J [Hippea maritima]AEA33017.1 Ribocuclease J [Hippea maritima DSM 10411]
MAEFVNVVALGGLDEIGLNSTVFETQNDMILVDAGLMFPEEDMLGVDIVIPDFSYIYENKDKLRALILTHAHEDHVGAIPYLLQNINVPIYGTKLTLGLVKAKLKEFKITNVQFVEIEPSRKFQIGDFELEPIRTTHSIVDGVGFAITTDVGVIIHTGDFKIDQTPVDGKPFDMLKFSEYGSKGVKLLLSDSTNATVKGFTGSEKEIKRGFLDIFSSAKGRILVVTFASNIHRIQQVVNTAIETNRKVCITGKSMVQNATIARQLGYLSIPDNVLVCEDEIAKFSDKELIIVTTGSQGEPMSGLSRIALGEHKNIKIKPTDTVVISAKAIPGNERAILKVINTLSRKGAKVFYEGNSNVHVSGHASQEELKLMINMVRPQYFMPIHGEYMMRRQHASIAEELGIPSRNIFTIDNGDVLTLTKDNAKMEQKIRTGRVFVDGKGVGDVEDVVIRDRIKLSTDGFVVVIVTVSNTTGELLSDPEIITKGLLYEEKSQKLLHEATMMVKNLINQSGVDLKTDAYEIKKKIRKAMNKFLHKKLMRNPMVLPIIMEI